MPLSDNAPKVPFAYQAHFDPISLYSDSHFPLLFEVTLRKADSAMGQDARIAKDL